MQLANQDQPRTPGYVNFIDNRLNGNTGTIRMRAVFPNKDGKLKSGLFVRVRVPIGSPYKTLLIPDEAIQSDQGKKFVYVINKDNKVEYRSVTLGQSVAGVHDLEVSKSSSSSDEPASTKSTEPVTLRVVKEGLKAGERVIVIGMQRVRPQMEVSARPQKEPRSRGLPLLKLLNQPAPPKTVERPQAKRPRLKSLSLTGASEEKNQAE
jgi:multidrug efflux system membrane fusion protein